jgi:hypothetical protein
MKETVNFRSDDFNFTTRNPPLGTLGAVASLLAATLGAVASLLAATL